MRILVITLAGIGDTLMCTPLIHELRANFPDATIDAFVLWAGSRDMLELNPHLNRIWQRNLISGSRLGSLRFLAGLRRERYDVSLNSHPQSRIHYRIVARLIAAQTRVSHEYDGSGMLDRLLVNRTVPQSYTRHTIENNLSLLPLIGAQSKLASHDIELSLSASDEEWARQFLAAHGLADCQRLGIHIGSGGTKNLALRRWPLDHYAGLIRRLKETRPALRILLLGGPSEAEEQAQLIAAVGSHSVFSVNSGNLRQAATLVGKCHAFLSVDTALMHVAAAMKVPGQIVIETPTVNPTIVPYGNPFTLVPNPAVAGRNLEYYRYDGRGIQGSAEELTRCMASVTVDQVHAAVESALQVPR